MSRWDNLMSERNRLAHSSIISAAFAPTYNLPTNSGRLFCLLALTGKNQWFAADIHDLALFIEDFVLCDHIAVSTGFSHLIGPYLSELYKCFDEYPLFDGQELLSDQLNSYVREIEESLDVRRNLKRTPVVNYRKWSGDEDMSLLPGMFGAWGINEDKKEIVRLEKEINIRSKEISLTEGLNYAMSTQRSIADESVSRNHLNSFFELANRSGFAFSLGHGYREIFEKPAGPRTLARDIYRDMEKNFKDEMALLEKWSAVSSLYVPPLFSIVLNAAKDREDFLRALVSVRAEYADVRKSLRETSAMVSSSHYSFKERLEIVNGLEADRERILKDKTNKSTRGVVRKTWDIVKKGDLYSAFVGLANVLLEWDEQRMFISGTRKILDIKRQTLLMREQDKKIYKLFGDIS